MDRALINKILDGMSKTHTLISMMTGRPMPITKCIRIIP